MTELPDPRQRPVLSVAEAGALLGFSRSRSYELAQSGGLPGVVRLGPRRLIVATATLLRVLGLADE